MTVGMRGWLKRHVSDRWRWRIHRLSRLRWITKAQLIRRERLPVHRHARYILFDPEVESYTYRVANLEGMLAAINEVTGIPLDTLSGYVSEADHDPELGERLARRLRWRFDVKRRPQLGNRLGWYVLIRGLRPELVVETGIYNGLGSLTLLRALQHNRAEGAPGRLVSFDRSDAAGWLVDERNGQHWERVLGSTADTLERTLSGRRVGALFQDSDHSLETQRLEFGAALANAAPTLLLVDGSGGERRVLQQLTLDAAAQYRCVNLGAADHWYQRGALAFAVLRTGDD
jgi:predicted O-methyltransferase YrrM